MASDSSTGNCLAWAARDKSGFLSPYTFNRSFFQGEIEKGDISSSALAMRLSELYKKLDLKFNGFKVGDHVGVGTYVNSCRDCEYCNDELEIHCSNGIVSTINGLDVDGTMTKGGYSSFIVVHKRYCYKIPEGYPLSLAAPLLCAGITVYTPMIRHKMNQPGKSLGGGRTRWSRAPGREVWKGFRA
ncbi:ALDEHYDE REDUCTASE [Salix koriyanagi]|uniref:ALDEHYDE REDUCTASE n=1 Tax=Salix koriyanagi TaxID=2511006 RepID=A0A9Q0ZV59_9ROSI|nr:ALDEHYDE REDUCTASE [Salix koriyanagi]